MHYIYMICPPLSWLGEKCMMNMIRNELFSKDHVEWELLHAKKILCD